MTRTATTGLILGGALALALGAYAVGSQAGGGSAAAQGSPAAYGQGYGLGSAGGARARDHGPGLDDLASRLGVTPAALRSALEALRPDGPPGRDGMRGELASSLAASLGLGVAKVQAALDKLAPKGRRWRGGDHDGPPGGRPPGGGPRPLRGHDNPGVGIDRIASALASALGVPKADVQKALVAFRAKEESQHATERNAFAQKLADKLGISADKVKSALERGGPGGGP